MPDYRGLFKSLLRRICRYLPSLLSTTAFANEHARVEVGHVDVKSWKKSAWSRFEDFDTPLPLAAGFASGIVNSSYATKTVDARFAGARRSHMFAAHTLPSFLQPHPRLKTVSRAVRREIVAWELANATARRFASLASPLPSFFANLVPDRCPEPFAETVLSYVGATLT